MSQAASIQDVRAVVAEFAMPGEYLGHEPCGHGHINDTYAVRFSQGGLPVRYIIQRINHHVFTRPNLVMENIRRVTEHIADKVHAAGEHEPDRRVLRLIRCADGRLWHQDPAGNHWRGYVFIERAVAHDKADSPEVAREAARAFGKFQQQLADLPGGRLADTIPDFHHTRKRYNRLMEAVAADTCGRVAGAAKALDFCRQREWMADVFVDLCASGRLPERVTHNDTKINNVMIDGDSGEGLCIMDLDTVMPGLIHFDFGDLVRTTCNAAAEDERDLSQVEMRMSYFDALIDGYLQGTGGFLTPTELDYLALSGPQITYELALRFLTDYLDGDRYFKIDRDKRPHHNLERFFAQAALVESMERQMDDMKASVDRAAKR